MHEVRSASWQFSSGDEHGDEDTELIAPFWERLYAAGVDVVLNGNDHVYERFAPQDPEGRPDPEGIREFVVGTGGFGHYGFGPPDRNSEVRGEGFWGVLRLELDPGSYRWEFLPAAGASFTDEGSAGCH